MKPADRGHAFRQDEARYASQRSTECLLGKSVLEECQPLQDGVSCKQGLPDDRSQQGMKAL